MGEPARQHLRLVNPETGELGEVLTKCPQCAEYEDVIAGQEKDLRAWRLRYADLMRDREAEIRNDAYHPLVERVFDYWRVQCRHPRSKLSVARFELALPFAKADGEETMMAAVAGARFDPYVTTRKNGSQKRHDGWELIFRDRGKFEEFCNRAPRPA